MCLVWQMQVRKMAMHFFQTFLGSLDRSELCWESQPCFQYELDVRTKPFCEEPYKNGNSVVRQDFARGDHGDDLIYMFGLMFLQDFKLPQGRYFAEEEKELAKRMMKGYG